jgi:hypothetical protein
MEEDKQANATEEDKQTPNAKTLNNLEIDKIIAGLCDSITLEEETEDLAQSATREEKIEINLQKNWDALPLDNFRIKENNQPHQDYDNHFNLGSTLLKSNFSEVKRSSLTATELKSDDSLLKRSFIAQKDEFLKIEEWEYMGNVEEVERAFSKIESQSKKCQ